jgi:hypothetical protein
LHAVVVCTGGGNLIFVRFQIKNEINGPGTFLSLSLGALFVRSESPISRGVDDAASRKWNRAAVVVAK